MPHDRGGHFFAQYFGVDRFLEIVESSQLDSRHRRTDVRIAGHDDHFAVRRLVPYPFEQRDAVAVGQAQVRQHHVEHAFPHPLDRLLTTLSASYPFLDSHVRSMRAKATSSSTISTFVIGFLS